MLHDKFQDHRTSCSGKEDLITHIWAWRPSWSCDLDHLYKLSFLLCNEAQHKQLCLIRQAVSVQKMFENHVNSPGAGADNPMGSNYFH